MVRAETINISSGIFDLDFANAVDFSGIKNGARPTDSRNSIFGRAFKNAVQNAQLEGSVTWSEGVLPNGLNLAPLTSAFCLIEDFGGVALLEATGPVSSINKELLAEAMDYAVESNCASIVACVPKTSPNFKAIVASFLSVGFTTMTPCHVSLAGYVLLISQL